MGFLNATPYVALDFAVTDHEGRAVVVAIVKATFDIQQGKATLAEEQIPLRANDVPLNVENPMGSIQFASDLCHIKHGADVLVVGEAVSRSAVKSLDVSVKVASKALTVRVFGDRQFVQGASDIVVGAALPFERMPIVYERAYGGMTEDLTEIEERNPAGVGVAKKKKDLVGRPAPQVEHPSLPHKTANDKHPPIGLGPIMTHWLPRRSYAGTFDETWKTTRMPMMPADYNIKYNNCAHPSLVFDNPLAPGDPVSVLGMHEDGLLAFDIPNWKAVARARFEHKGKVTIPLGVDTLVLHPNDKRFEMVGRYAFPVGRGGDVLRELSVDFA
ncbi:MAG: DUF2169 domain-containing protein [Polyangiaceae bacterium]|nr:DUF2169 domain-containing protein [Polyangiaceae bacterium]